MAKHSRQHLREMARKVARISISPSPIDQVNFAIFMTALQERTGLPRRILIERISVLASDPPLKRGR